MYEKLLIGTTKDKELVFATVRIDTKNCFTCSYEIVMPFVPTRERCLDAAEIIADPSCSSYKYVYNLLEEYDCPLSELTSRMADFMEIEDLFDTSCYAETYSVDGEDWYFESVCSGQCILNTLQDVVSPEVYQLIGMWHLRHLKTVTDEERKMIEDTVKIIEDCVEDEANYIKDFISKNFSNQEEK